MSPNCVFCDLKADSATRKLSSFTDLSLKTSNIKTQNNAPVQCTFWHRNVNNKKNILIQAQLISLTIDFLRTF